MAMGMLRLLPLPARTSFVVFTARLSRTAKVWARSSLHIVPGDRRNHFGVSTCLAGPCREGSKWQHICSLQVEFMDVDRGQADSRTVHVWCNLLLCCAASALLMLKDCLPGVSASAWADWYDCSGIALHAVLSRELR